MRSPKRVPAIFFRTAAGREPVRDWLKELPTRDRKAIGDDIRAVEFGWPMGMPLVRPLGDVSMKSARGFRAAASPGSFSS